MLEEALHVIEIFGSLIGVIAVLYTRQISLQLQIERKDNESLWEAVGEFRGALQETREHYLTKEDFNGTICRLFEKLDKIDGHLSDYITKPECRDFRRDCK